MILWFLLLSVTTLGLLFYWKKGQHAPIADLNKMNEKQTVGSVIETIEQKAFQRLAPSLRRLGLTGLPDGILLIGLKEERLLEVYAYNNAQEPRWLKDYPFTAFSGRLGPKLREGDRQIPEGIYEIGYLNPNSAFYLSMKINYPNKFDEKMGQLDGRKNLGSDIFIHGKAATIGCIPIGDEAIEELFLLVAKCSVKPVKIIISPHDFRKKKVQPMIENIGWEDELYRRIKAALSVIDKNS